VAEVSLDTRAIFSVVGRGRKWNGGSGFALGRRTAKKRPRGRQDPGGLCAHSQDAAATRRQDLEVELVEAHTEFFAGPAQSFFDRLASELVVSIAECSHG
jgi:hypothetical protein